MEFIGTVRERLDPASESPSVDLLERLDLLMQLASELEIEVRAEPLGGAGGGLCRLKGRRVLFVDTSADLETRYEKTAAGLAAMPELEERYLPPEVRADLARFSGRASA